MADIYAWMATGPEGDYPLAAIVPNAGGLIAPMPMMTTKEEIARGARFRLIAQLHAEHTGERVRLLRYEIAEELQVIPSNPPTPPSRTSSSSPPSPP